MPEPRRRADVLEGEVGGWSVDQARTWHERGWLCEPRRVPERADLSPGLMPRARAAVEALVEADVGTGFGGRTDRRPSRGFLPFGCGALLHDVWDADYPEALAAHEPSQHVIVGELIGDGFKSANRARLARPLVDEHGPEL